MAISKKKTSGKVEATPGETSRALAVPDGEKIKNWADNEDSEQYRQATKLYDQIRKAYENKQELVDRCGEYWNIYNAQLDENQQYNGNSSTYIPAVRDAINKRVKRTLRQLFPVNHKHISAVGPTGETPWALMSLGEHYIRQTKLKSIIRSMLIAGDVTGQWALYVDWTKTYRDVRKIVRAPKIDKMLEGGTIDLAEEEDIFDEDETIEEEEVIEEGPDIVNVAVEDIAILPPTCTDPKKAKATSVLLRMSQEECQRMIDEGVFVGVNAKELLESFDKKIKNPNKQRAMEAGIKSEGTDKHAMIYEVETKMTLDKDYKESVYIYYAGKDMPVGIIRNPQWSGRSPLITAPIERISGTWCGISKIEPIKWLQWGLNDFAAMGFDSAQYSLLPIVMTDPLKNPNYQSMVLGLAAVWLTNPKETEFVNFPQIWKDSAALQQFVKAQIAESLDVNDSMLGKQPAGRKNNAAVGAQQQEQQSDIQDNAERCEEEIMNPLMERIMELDAQFRTDELIVETMGETGYRAKIQTIDPQDFGFRVSYRWEGTSYQMNLQRMQQMVSWVNVLRGINPQQLNGRRLDITPILQFGTEHICGPEMAGNILIDERNLFTVPPGEENIMLFNGLPVVVHEADNDQEHITSHQQAATLTGDPAGHYRAHLMEHLQHLQIKMQKQMGQQAQGGQSAPGQGMPGGQQPPGGGAPGVPGTPRIGAQPAPPRPQGPPGGVHPDQMASPGMGPR
jgi:hypothetical protein